MTVLVLLIAGPCTGAASEPQDLWQSAMQQRDVHRFSTLFIAQDIRDRLSSGEGLDAAVNWCRQTGVTKVYIEEFRDGYQAGRDDILRVKERFLREGFDVAGCITTTKVGKPSTGWKESISCYTDPATQKRIKALFEYAAGLFDEIMIDDFWFTDCECSECRLARQSRSVKIGDRSFAVPGDSWSDYRSELMVNLSRESVLSASRKVNPDVKLIIKYPQWYDQFHDRGYEVVRETQDFDRIWVGTETRDFTDREWGGTVQYAAYFLMRWLGRLGGEKCGGGWYDWLGTTEKTYIEQARQTVLAGARESMLFCYGGLQEETGPRNIKALRAELQELLRVAGEVRRRQIVGIAAYKPPNSEPGKEGRVFDFVGMLGLPLVPCHEFPQEAPAAFLSIHALQDAQLASKLSAFIQAGKPVLLTDGLAARLRGRLPLDAPNVRILKVGGNPKLLLKLTRKELDPLRAFALQPWKISLEGPNRLGFYLFDDGSRVVENFDDQAATIECDGRSSSIPPRGWQLEWR